VAATALAGARPLLAHEEEDEDELIRLEGVLDDCRRLVTVVEPLHEAGFVWLNFAPEKIEKSENKLQITNLDLRLFPVKACPASLRLSRLYSPPELWHFQSDKIGPATDVFHFCAYAYYRLAGLFPKGFPGKGLEAFDFDVPPLRVYRPQLPVGVESIIRRGLDRNTGRRYSSVGEFVARLEAAVDHARLRYRGSEGLTYEVGGLTRPGRAKSALGKVNQDVLHVETLNGGVPVVLVADGVSHARLGTGDMASRTVWEVLAPALPRLARQEAVGEVERGLTATCVEAGQTIVRLAFQQPPPPGKVRPAEVMSSTALIGLVRGSTLTVANVGDCRAYLLTTAGIEQLTVDGDVRCSSLAGDTAPEDVRDLGQEGQALAYCLGACRDSPNGIPECDVERSSPQISHWPLLPGDVVLFCSDGLIEEGMFLDPADAAAIVAAKPELPAQAMAERLVEAADSRQREPSAAEPDGFGDNITCVLLKVLSRHPEVAKES
jgi:serine/threonine protein phosphatase PrpC